MRHVAIILDTSGSYGRGLLRGIMRYVTANGPWRVYAEFATAEHPVALDRWRGDGILARVRSPQMAAALNRIDVPKVVLSPLTPDPALRSLTVMAAAPDRVADARLAVQHFVDRGFRHVWFCSERDRLWHGRLDPLVAAAVAAGIGYDLFETGPGVSWQQRQDALVQWLRGLARPAAVCAVNDRAGHEVLDAAAEAGLHVPEDVAVLGSDNDDSLCALCTPPLSSIDHNTEEIGYRSAAALDRLMAGGTPPDATSLVPPLGIITRQSTDVLAMDDREVAVAVRFIREHATDPITVDDVLREIAISRRSLERRFAQAIGRSPHEEIRRMQVERAKQLLAATRLKVSAIATECGFHNATLLGQTFARLTGTTPSAFRRRNGWTT